MEKLEMEKADWKWEEVSEKISQAGWRLLLLKEREEFLEDMENKYYY
jgi:hypothetical protein